MSPEKRLLRFTRRSNNRAASVSERAPSRVGLSARRRVGEQFVATVFLALLCCWAVIVPAYPKANYKKWLDQEVVWIISRLERQEFKKLEDDTAREAFIEMFWKRRDPTPATERNEYKEEHYRRFLYATRMFQEGIPGWKTDRGRVYILHGAPDGEHFFTSLSTISPLRPVPSTQRSPNTIVWVYHQNQNARYYKGEIRLVFQPSSGLSRQNFALGESKAAQDRADQLARQFGPAADPNMMEADVRYQLIMAGPPAVVNARGAELPTSGIGELAKHIEDLFRSPGDILEDTQREIERREHSRSELRHSVKTVVSFDARQIAVAHKAFFQRTGDWLVCVEVNVPLEDLADDKIDLYAALVDARGELFDEFVDSVEVESERLRQAGQQQLRYFNTFSAPSGTYTLKVVVRQVRNRRTSYSDARLDLAVEHPAQIKLGALMLSNRVEVLPVEQGSEVSETSIPWSNSIVYNGTRLLPNPSQTFQHPENLFLYFQIWVPPEGKDLSINANFIQGDQIVKRLPARMIEKSAGACVEYGTVIPLADFAAGNYILQVQVLDHNSKKFDIRRTVFRITNDE